MLISNLSLIGLIKKKNLSLIGGGVDVNGEFFSISAFLSPK